MPRTRSLAFSELKIGILAVVALVIAATVIFDAQRPGRLLLAALPAQDALPGRRRASRPGRRSASPAWRSARSATSRSRATRSRSSSRCRRRSQPRITTESVAALGSLSLLGQTTVDITPVGRRRSRFPDWGYVTERQGCPGSSPTWRPTPARGSRSCTRAAARDARGQGDHRAAVHRRALYRRGPGVRPRRRAGGARPRSGGEGTVGKLVTRPGGRTGRCRARSTT